MYSKLVVLSAGLRLFSKLFNMEPFGRVFGRGPTRNYWVKRSPLVHVLAILPKPAKLVSSVYKVYIIL